tara:strand:- start:53 stop:475 length:423 start_codon:yes stop_codon:yes gene_type:complete
MNELDIDTISNFYFPENQSNDIEISFDEEKLLFKLCENCINLLNLTIIDYGNLNHQGRVNDLSNIIYRYQDNIISEKVSDFLFRVKKLILKNIESSNNEIHKIIISHQINFEIENLLIALAYEGTDSSIEEEINFCSFIK